MKQQRTKKALLAFQALILAGITGLAVMGLLSFKTAERFADFWELLGTSKQTGTNKIKESFLDGYFHYSGRHIKTIATGSRAAIAKDLLTYTKEYVGSEAFAKEYETFRQWSKPVPPEAGRTEAVIRQKFIDDAKKGVENLEKFMKTSNDEKMKKQIEKSLVQARQALKDYQDPNSQMIKYAVQGEETQYNSRLQQYQDNLKAWEEGTPASPKALVKVRLQHLLAVTKDVDFGAQLTERQGMKYFVNREYENKPAEWKMAFRAGKEVTTAVRSFAQQWLQELP